MKGNKKGHLQFYHLQEEDKGKCQSATEYGRGSSDRRHKRQEVVNVFSALDFTEKICLLEFQASAIIEKSGAREVGEHLSRLDVSKSMGTGGTHPEVLRKMTHVTVRPILSTFVTNKSF